MQVDYIVVGLGLAGIALCEQLRSHNKSFVVIDQPQSSASTVASGLYNPIVLKRFVPAWKGHELMQRSLPYYKKLEKKLKTSFIHSTSILRRFTAPSELNDWQHACSSLGMASYMDPLLKTNTNTAIDAPFGYGMLQGTGWVDCSLLLSAYRSLLLSSSQLREDLFDYDRLNNSDHKLGYDDITAHKIVFTEGIGMIKNPWFSYLPLRRTKGELLVIHCPDLNESNILHSGIFIIPLGNNHYKVGATYNNHDKTTLPTNEGRSLLESRLKKILQAPYTVVDHMAGLRPTTPDRRPLVGLHPKDKRMSVINGLGSRGVLQAPFTAKSLLEHIEYGRALDPEIDVFRYESSVL